MEAKKFISTLKGFKTRFTNKPNVDLEKKSVESLSEKFGGKLEAIATLKEHGENELKDYLKSVLGLSGLGVSETADKGSKKVGQTISLNEGVEEYATVDGKVYKLDSIKKTMKRVFKDLKDLNVEDIETEVMPMTVYQRYLKDRFLNEDAPIKKGKLHFRGYRIYCDKENGFVIEDTNNRYEVVSTPFEGIPTPKELGDWFEKPKREETPEQLRAAVERGKELAQKKKELREVSIEEEAPDYEALRKKVLSTIKLIRSKTVDFDPTKFPEMIPFRRWKRGVNSLISQWKGRKIRYAKLINEIERLTLEETFEIVERNHRSSFKGTARPCFDSVGAVKGDMIEVDGRCIEAVPFLVEYLLSEEPKVMSQLMKFAYGEIDAVGLLKNPILVDWKVEYNKKALKNTEYNTGILRMLYDAVGVTAPQDILYGSGLKEGDKIAIMLEGTLKYRKVTSTEGGIFLGKSTGYLLKYDNWFKVQDKE